MSDIKRYYDEEMRYLLGAGREYAREFPDAAHALSIAEVEDRDPFVERLFENFAFLTARVRQTLDSQDDGMAGQLLDQAAPGLECPLPATSVVELVPRADTSETGSLVARGSEIRTPQLSGMLRPSRFRTTQDCPIHPLRLHKFSTTVADDGQACLEFHLQAIDAVGILQWPNRLDLFISGDSQVAWTIRHWLLHKVRRIEVSTPGNPGQVRFTPPTASVGYTLETAPSSQPLLDIRDFLCADDRFRFVTMQGLDTAIPSGIKTARIRVQFTQPLPKLLERGVEPTLLRINATPVVNAFSEPSQPHLLDPARTEYPLLAADGGEREVLETEIFQGASQSDPTKSHTYQRFSTWRHSSRRSPDTGWYQVHRRPNRSGGMKTSIQVGHPDPEFAFKDEYLGGILWCCDGDQPSEIIRPIDLNEPSTGIPSGLAIVGLVRPSQVYRPPSTPDFRWKLLSHFQRSFRDLSRVKELQETLRLLMWDPRELKKAFINNITELDLTTGYELIDGLTRPITQVRLTITDPKIQGDSWEHIGALDCFGGLIHRLLAPRTPVGTRLTLSLRILPLGLALEHEL